MLNVCIVDDEAHMRNTIRRLGDWQRWNMRVTEAAHGEEALRLAESERLDLIILDMNMPVMDGVALLERLKGSGCEAIVISGHDDFRYMHQAIGYRVIDYLLKPISRGDLNEALAKAVETLVGRTRGERNAKLKQLLSRLLWQDPYDNASLCGEIRQLDAAGWETMELHLFLCRNFREISMERFQRDSNLLMFAIENVLTEHYEQEGEPIVLPGMTGKCEFVVIVRGRSVDARAEGGDEALRRFMLQSLQLRVDALHSGRIDDWPSVQKAYKRLWNDWLQQPWIPTAAVGAESAHPEPLPAAAPTADGASAYAASASAFSAGELSHQLRQSSWEQVESHLRQWLDELTALKRLSNLGVYERIGDFLRALYGSVDDRTGESRTARLLSPLKLEHFLEIGFSKETLLDYLLGEARKACDIALANRPKSDMERVADYLRLHYTENISLDRLAARFYLSKSYLCKSFKNKLGCTIVEFVTAVRPEQARRFIREKGYSAQNAAEFVGFHDYSYFSKLYKKKFGRPPSLDL